MRQSIFRPFTIFLSALFLFFPAIGSAALPRQDVVIVIDSSGSVEKSDPQGLRGVAANLILDAAELTSQVSAGLVFFSDQVQADSGLENPRKLRFRLQGDNLPASGGATNMREALEAATSLLGNSNAPIKKIIVITDGVPTAGNGGGMDAKQTEAIRSQIVPRAKSAGIKIYALGFSGADRAFMEEVCNPTGGQALIADHVRQLPEKAKQLLENADNLSILENRKLPGHQSEFTTAIPRGIDRARITLVLESPNLFLPDQLEMEFSGPGGRVTRDDGMVYTGKKDGDTYLAAWTYFLESPPGGDYTLKVTSSKPGFSSHRGVTVFLEARSNLGLSIGITPEKETYYPGEEVQVEVGVSNPSGPVTPDKVRGVAVTEAGEHVAIRFSGPSGTFTVPDIAGRLRLELTATVKGLPPLFAESTLSVEQAGLPALMTDPATLNFSKILGPEFPEVSERFSLFTVYADEDVRKEKVQVHFRWSVPPSIHVNGEYLSIGDWAMVTSENGAKLPVDGKRRLMVPESGVSMHLTMAFPDLNEVPLLGQIQGDVKAVGALEIYSKTAGNAIEVPVEIGFRIPSFELVDENPDLALWWKPDHPVQFQLGQVLTDSSHSARYSITLPRYIHAVGDSDAVSRPLAEIRLLQDGTPVQGAPQEDQIRYEGFELSKTKSPVTVEISPLPEEDRPAGVLGPQPFKFQLASAFGTMDREYRLWAVGPPLFTAGLGGPLSLHGMHLFIWLLLAFLTLLSWVFLNWGRRIWRTRNAMPGKALIAKAVGTFGIGQGSALSLLPAPKAPALDQKLVGRMRNENGQIQMVGTPEKQVSRNGAFLGKNDPKPLRVGDAIAIVEERDGEPVWELEVTDMDPGEREIDMEIVVSPFRTGFRKLLVRFALVAALILVAIQLARTDAVADLAYRLPLVEGFYTHLLLPFASALF